ncbi:MAG: zinc ribbon domain-containing protein [Candidatus Micrarchaeota archaeon]|nr:zinc ribbon domain-containing protein [Candidatus Micrarchaeota archaeon]
MGFLDGIAGKVKSDIEWKAGQTITDTVVKGAGSVLNKGGSPTASNSCIKCKKAIPEPRPKFCPSCGAALIVSCKKCNAEYPAGTNFCTGCGTKL